MVKKEDIIRLKRGIYIFNQKYQDSFIDKISVANMLYVPSYVSFEYALSYYGLIPERVYEVTSASIRAKRTYETSIGRFSYRRVPLKAFSVGIDWLYDEELGGRLIATKEKALCDKVRSEKKLGKLTQEKLWSYFINDLRIESDELIKLDVELVRDIAMAYNSRKLRDIGVIIAKRKKSG
ncbi:MAG: hypothetical protein JKY28_00025 [Sulfurimonas sp.]|nr:hypothetical protein [Sulfurimonas sp.]